MSHEILLEDRLVFTGQTPWHGIGIALPANARFEDWVARSGFTWEIEIAPVDFTARYESLARRFPKRFVMYRSDSKTPLAIASERFKPVQPREVLAFFKDLVETQGFQLETVGTLQNGKYIWGLAKVGKMGNIGKQEDLVRSYLLLVTICQPGFATSVRFTAIRVVCNNTMQVALEGGSAITKVSHTEEFDSARLKDAMGLGISSFERYILQARKLAERKITHEEAMEFFMHVLGDPELEPEDPKQPLTLVQVQRNYLDSPYHKLIPSSGYSLWSAVNAVTNHVDFHRPNRGVGGRLASAWFGSGQKMKEEAWSIAETYERTGSFEETKSDATTG